LRTHYLLDHDYVYDEESGHASMGHLLIFNLNPQDAQVTATVYFEDREPESFELVAHAGMSTETNYEKWPVQRNSRFALQIESDIPVVCQSTNGWNNSLNDYSTSAQTRSPHGVRECAKSYMSIHRLDQDWYVADCLIIDNLEQIWVRESEWALLLNPGDKDARVMMTLYYAADDKQEIQVELPARRLCSLYMDQRARRNVHYGVHFHSDQPIAAQWLRTVKWSEESELMAYWSVPCITGPLDG
jgi:hypothetical protein